MIKEESEISVVRALEAFGRGEIVVVSDSSTREGEGDLCVAASACTLAQMAFMIHHTSGIICAPLTAEIAHKLHLSPMVAVNEAPLQTGFTVSVDAKEDLATGISARERTNTVRALADPKTTFEDLVRPGHVFPLLARNYGVVERPGHTEACVDLARLSGLSPVGVLGELMNPDGTVMNAPQVQRFAQAHNLRHLHIKDLVHYRYARERFLQGPERHAEVRELGQVQVLTYGLSFSTEQYYALLYGEELCSAQEKEPIASDSLSNSRGEKEKKAGAEALVPTFLYKTISSPSSRVAKPQISGDSFTDQPPTDFFQLAHELQNFFCKVKEKKRGLLLIVPAGDSECPSFEFLPSSPDLSVNLSYIVRQILQDLNLSLADLDIFQPRRKMGEIA